MAWWSRRPGIPAEVAAIPEPGERILGWGTGPAQRDGTPTFAVATDQALYLPAYVGRLPWQQVIRAGWDAPVLEVSYTPSGAPVGTSPKILRVTLDDPGAVPEAVRDRVTASVAVQQHVDLGSGRGATLIARRTGDAGFRWQVIFDAGLDPADPQLRAEADAALRELRSTLGI